MARMKEMPFLSRRFVPAEAEGERMRGLERYLTRQSKELYVRLSYLEKRIAALEEQLTSAQSANQGEE